MEQEKEKTSPDIRDQLIWYQIVSISCLGWSAQQYFPRKSLLEPQCNVTSLALVQSSW